MALSNKKVIESTWEELQKLQSETEMLLQTVKGKEGQEKGKEPIKGFRTGGAKEILKETTTTDGLGATITEVKSTKKKKKASAAVTSLSLDGGLDKTRNLYGDRDNRQGGRITVEVLDDASPDNTPRGEEEVKSEKARKRSQREDAVRMQNMTEKEADFRKLNFDHEKTRLLQNDDVFVPAPGVTAEDVKKERERLNKLEESARNKRKAYLSEVGERREYLQQDRAMIKIQKTFRGHIGRQRFKLFARLKTLEQGEELEWIEVRDRESGDVWYYNRITGLSQWDRPEDMFSSLAPHDALKRISASVESKTQDMMDEDGGKGRSLNISMTLPSHNATQQAKGLKKHKTSSNSQDAEHEKQRAARREVENMMGLDKIMPTENLFAPDATFKPQLRKTVLDALLETRFDSVSTVLADDRWMEGASKDPFEKTRQLTTIEEAKIEDGRVDKSKKALVSVLTFNKKKKRPVLEVDPNADPYSPTELLQQRDLTVKEVEHPGFDENTPYEPNTMCFGCWSAGARRQCSLHQDGDAKLKVSQTMLLCRNWELGVMRRRYRSEEIQEIFMKKGSSLRYDVKRKKFLTVVEQRHQIYRGLKNLIEVFNFRMLLWMKIKRWLNSLTDEVRTRKTAGKAAERVKLMRDRRTLVHSMQLNQLLKEIVLNLPAPPVTGTSWPERTGEIQFLYKRADQASGQEVELIIAYPTPDCKKLFATREYHLPAPRTIPMPRPEYKDGVAEAVLPANTMIAEDNKASWFERLVRATTRVATQAAVDQVKTISPIPGIELMRRTKQPPPCSIKFATIGRKPVPSNTAVGGLPMELLVYQLISTFVPPQYGNLMVMDKSTVSPGVSPEIIIQFHSLLCGPITQVYVLRPLEHPLNYRRAPTITANSAADPDNKHYYGTNRPEQTGEQESHGFRTTCWARNLITYEITDPSAFTPGPEVVSLNVPASNRSVTTHADHTYPFCEPSTRDNSTLDFFHLLLQGAISASKAQVFTALTVQEPGLFLKECRQDLPMGHLVVSVYRSWAFTQKDTIEEFKTDDNISYWYHRRTGQTFWERPLYEDEEPSALKGGTILDMVHPEEPLTVHKGHEGATRRYTQGEFRIQMLAHHENDDEAKKRRLTAQSSSRIAKDRGQLPSHPPGLEHFSMDNNSAGEEDVGSRLHVGLDVEQSMMVSTSSGGVGGGPKAPNGLTSGQHLIQTHEMGVAEAHAREEALRTGKSLEEDNMSQGSHVVANNPMAGMFGGSTGGGGAEVLPGVSADMMQNLTQSLGAMLSQLGMMESSNPQEMIKIGMGMGMALLGSNAVQNMTSQIVDPQTGKPVEGSSHSWNRGKRRIQNGTGDDFNQHSDFFPALTEDEVSDNQSILSEQLSKNSISGNVKKGPGGPPPIGKAHPTELLGANKVLSKSEQEKQKAQTKALLDEPLTSLQNARALKVALDPTETPDVAPEKVLTIEQPKNAEEGMKEKIPVLAYPELSSYPIGGPPNDVDVHDSAGIGTSYVLPKDDDKQLRVKGSDILRKTVVPLPVGFFNAIIAKHVAKQTVDYLPQVPNLPQSRTVGRVKPRSSAVDWMAISFDPWSAGKKPLNSEFVSSLASKTSELFGGDPNKASDMMDQMRETNKDAFMTLDDKEGIADQRREITKGQLIAQDFAKACSLCRHSKFADVEELVNQPDWNVPIDYQDDLGNTLLHVVSQNGNRRLIKLCMRRGADLNLQNLTGQTALHFAFGYGYVEAGEYLVKKGADDSIRNKDGLTCYEGLGARELELL